MYSICQQFTASLFFLGLELYQKKILYRLEFLPDFVNLFEDKFLSFRRGMFRTVHIRRHQRLLYS